MRVWGAALLCVAVAGCTAATKTVWIRTDGQRIASDPVNLQQAQIDRTICQGETDKASLSGVTFTGGGMAGVAAAIERDNAAGRVASGCMAAKGYVQVPEDQAETRLQEFATITAEKKRREEAAAVPPAQSKKRPAPIKPAS